MKTETASRYNTEHFAWDVIKTFGGFVITMGAISWWFNFGPSWLTPKVIIITTLAYLILAGIITKILKK